MYISEGFHIDKRSDAVAMGKAFDKPGFVLMDSLFDVICDADVQCAGLVGHDVDVIDPSA